MCNKYGRGWNAKGVEGELVGRGRREDRNLSAPAIMLCSVGETVGVKENEKVGQ